MGLEHMVVPFFFAFSSSIELYLFQQNIFFFPKKKNVTNSYYVSDLVKINK